MENDNFSTQLIISKLLPFMNEKFFWDFLAKENVSYKDVKVVYTDGLPGNYAFNKDSLCSGGISLTRGKKEIF
jgi:hypothetical protein